MKITATELARKTGNIVDQVLEGQTATLERHGKPLAELRVKPGVSGQELARRLRRSPLQEDDARRLRAGCEKANQPFSDGHRDIHGVPRLPRKTEARRNGADKGNIPVILAADEVEQ